MLFISCSRRTGTVIAEFLRGASPLFAELLAARRRDC
jgi:hypothetical protein